MATTAKSMTPEASSEGTANVVPDGQNRIGLPHESSPDKVACSEPSKSGAHEEPSESFRCEITAEIYAMSRYLTGGDRKEAFSPHAATVLGSLDRGERPLMEDLLPAHNDLKGLVSPATPNALLANCDLINNTGFLRFLGPYPVVRHLALANIFFLLLFFGISLRPEVNLTTLNLSIYEQSGFPLLIKLVFLVAAAGLGASFGGLFDVWDQIKAHTFDPSGESVHWMKVGLGIVAGLTLTEIFQASASIGGEVSSSDALLALVGGFSAGLLHVALSRTVNAFKSIFAAPGKN